MQYSQYLRSRYIGLGLNLEWMSKPKLNALQRRVELNYLQLSSGRESANKIRGSFSLRKALSLGKGIFAYGGVVTVLRLPAFMGDRFEVDIFVEQSTSAGPPSPPIGPRTNPN